MFTCVYDIKLLESISDLIVLLLFDKLKGYGRNNPNVSWLKLGLYLHMQVFNSFKFVGFLIKK